MLKKTGPGHLSLSLVLNKRIAAFGDENERVGVTIDLPRIRLGCVQTIEPESGWGGHFHTFLVFLSTLTLNRWFSP